MRYPRRRRSVLQELFRREYGVPCPLWTSMHALRKAVFGPRRKWVNIFQTKQSSLLELSGDLLWLTITDQPNTYRNVMKRILGNGQLMTLYTLDVFPRPKETEIYEIPDPVYRSSIPQQEYQPVIIGLRKGSVLTRHNLDTGRLYDRVSLGPSPTNSLAINYVADILVVKSPRLSLGGNTDFFFRFHVFRLHPFKHLTTFDIDSTVFPSKEDKEEFGKLRNAEIHDGLLLVMTEKSYNLVYDAEKIIEDCMIRQEEVNESIELRPVCKVSQVPQLLFSTFAHLDILGLGACPWTFIRAVSDSVLEVRDMGSGELLGGGKVTWHDDGDPISPDYLMFHPDDTSRVIHVRTQEIRILGIHMRDGKRVLEEEFTYPEKRKNAYGEGEVRYSRSGRPTRPRFRWDNSLNRALSFNVETDLRVLVILEAWRDERFNCTRLGKVVFYDSFTYELLHQMEVGVRVEGDIETNRLSVSIDRDILNIVSHKGTQHTVLAFRLKEDLPTEEEEESIEDESEDTDGISNRSCRSDRNRIRAQKRSEESGRRGTTKKKRNGEEDSLAKKKKRRRTGRQESYQYSSESDYADDDDWTP